MLSLRKKKRNNGSNSRLADLIYILNDSKHSASENVYSKCASIMLIPFLLLASSEEIIKSQCCLILVISLQ